MPQLSYAQLGEIIKSTKAQIPIGSVRYHRKHPDRYYTIVDVIIDEATDSASIIYESIPSVGVRFGRLAGVFLQSVTTDDGLQPRFVRVA